MYQIEYSPLNYYNNDVSDECLCVGVLFHNLTNGKRDFKYISNFDRFHSFDDEANIEFLKCYFRGIKEEVEENIFNKNKHFNISEYIKIYVNSLRFAKPQTIQFDEKIDYVDILSRMFMKFDYKKEKRLKPKEEKKYIKQILLGTNSPMRSPKIEGLYKEAVNFDYISGNNAIKYFSFKDKDLKKFISTAKSWSFNADEVKNKLNVIFIYDEINPGQDADAVLNILKKSAKVFALSNFSNYFEQNYQYF